MEQNRQDLAPPSDPDRQIGSLLGRMRNRSSIVDRLMDIPAPFPEGPSEAPEWDAAVVRRLEARLADTMRAIIEPGAEKKSA
jgi:hypothetical protein